MRARLAGASSTRSRRGGIEVRQQRYVPSINQEREAGAVCSPHDGIEVHDLVADVTGSIAHELGYEGRQVRLGLGGQQEGAPVQGDTTCADPKELVGLVVRPAPGARKEPAGHLLHAGALVDEEGLEEQSLLPPNGGPTDEFLLDPAVCRKDDVPRAVLGSKSTQVAAEHVEEPDVGRPDRELQPFKRVVILSDPT